MSSKPPIRWGAALLGGCVAIAGGAFFGTLIASASLRVSMAEGMTEEQAVRAISSGTAWATFVLSAILTGACEFAGGFVAAKFAGSRPIAQAGAASVFTLLFMLVTFLNPSSQFGSTWYTIYSIFSPILASLLGGYVYARRI